MVISRIFGELIYKRLTHIKNYVMNEFPLHWSVYENDVESLKSLLKRTPKTELEVKDARGKTPLELAIFLNHYDCAKLLVEHGADCCHVTKAGWNRKNLIQFEPYKRN